MASPSRPTAAKAKAKAKAKPFRCGYHRFQLASEAPRGGVPRCLNCGKPRNQSGPATATQQAWAQRRHDAELSAAAAATGPRVGPCRCGRPLAGLRKGERECDQPNDPFHGLTG